MWPQVEFSACASPDTPARLQHLPPVAGRRRALQAQGRALQPYAEGAAEKFASRHRTFGNERRPKPQRAPFSRPLMFDAEAIGTPSNVCSVLQHVVRGGTCCGGRFRLRMESIVRSPTASPMIVGMGTPPLNSMPWFDGICSQGGPKPQCRHQLCAHANRGRQGGRLERRAPKKSTMTPPKELSMPCDEMRRLTNPF
jgi:hypothetical protein